MEKFTCTIDEIRAISFFSTSLYLKESVEEVLWDITKNVIHQLGFVDCVIYTMDYDTMQLTQSAAYGIKNPCSHQIYNQIRLNLGEGIVGSIAQSKKPEIIMDTSKDSRYIVDDRNRLSEICVPIMVNNKLFGVIDAEHPDKMFFNEKHLYLLTIIASLCAQKIKELQLKSRKPFKRANQYFKKLEALMHSKKIYRNPYLSLTTTADILGISPCYLSSMVNSILNKSFIDFVNEYRICDVKRNLNAQTFEHYTIVSVGLEAGFNSKSAFYSAFKKHTGLTPLEYKNRHCVMS
ncbi:helix-turn-helix domain-containing protein [Maribacter algicola]|uniref:Helix-turn-helix domain-containing protein n=1 Tax=Maribacter algicola TaxID=2498892 RepID=A0A426RI16_9FLAO|nr:helix-turn-helix domain-containing protein [Maribacter algicola]RRQ48647.1 helix-turn-helix domain-containing protein [Maribacter algicola]